MHVRLKLIRDATIGISCLIVSKLFASARGLPAAASLGVTAAAVRVCVRTMAKRALMRIRMRTRVNVRVHASASAAGVCAATCGRLPITICRLRLELVRSSWRLGFCVHGTP